MRRDQKFFLLHDNAHPHTAAIVQQFLAKKGVTQLSHPSYLQDLSPWLFCFRKIKIGPERWPLRFDRRHSEICNHKIKSVPILWLCMSYETGRGSCQRVYLSVRRLFGKIGIIYLNFFFTVFAVLSQNLPDTTCIFYFMQHFDAVFMGGLGLRWKVALLTPCPWNTGGRARMLSRMIASWSG